MNLAKQIFDNNRDLLERVKKEKFKTTYIKDEDIFFITFAKGSNDELSISVDNDSFIIHYDPKTLKITGFTVPSINGFLEDCSVILRNKKIEEFEEKYSARLTEPVITAGMAGLSFAAC